jgi:hypothetical protein
MDGIASHDGRRMESNWEFGLVLVLAHWVSPDVSLIRGFSRKNNMRGDIECHEKPDQRKAHLLVGAQQGRTKNTASAMSTHNVAIPWMFPIHFAPDRVHRKVQISLPPAGTISRSVVCLVKASG